METPTSEYLSTHRHREPHPHLGRPRTSLIRRRRTTVPGPGRAGGTPKWIRGCTPRRHGKESPRESLVFHGGLPLPLFSVGAVSLVTDLRKKRARHCCAGPLSNRIRFRRDGR